MSAPDATSPETPSIPPQKASVWEDFLDIIYAPADVFRRRANGNFWLPLLVTTILISLLAYANRNIIRPVFDAEFARGAAAAMQKNPQLTQDAYNRIRDVSFAVAQFGSLVLIPLLILVSAFVIWLLVKAFGTRVSWNAALIIASFAMVAKVVQSIALSIQGLLLDPAGFTSRFAIQIGPGRFMHASGISPIMGSVYDRLDIFILWGVVLVAIGAATVGKMSKGKATLFGVVYWVLAWLPGLVGALRQ
ncbi:MAG TPA: YIP1 family protein [Gemmatimonadaceae bacterium]|jgi:hypothetical protein|nr:YIP1 family protein [Gemmatimonadaceae bacterium]